MPRVDEDEQFLNESDEADEDDEIAFDDDSELAPSEDGLSLVEASDDEDLVSLDQGVDIPDGLIEYDGSDASDAEEEEWGGIGNTKRKRKDEMGGQKKKLKSLPTFATYEDYAKMIEDGPEDDL